MHTEICMYILIYYYYTLPSFQLHCQQNTISKQMEEHLSELVDMVESITLKYKLASLLSFRPTILSLINDSTIYYLRDMDFGRRDENQNN